MTPVRRALLLIVGFVCLLTICILSLRLVRERRKGAVAAVESGETGGPSADARDVPASGDRAATVFYAHNLRLRQGPMFRVYVRWIRGQMLRTRKDDPPSLDDPSSFALNIEKGVIHSNIGDVSNFLNANLPKNAPMTKISLEADGQQVKLHGTAHKIFPLPVVLEGQFTPTADGRVRFHVLKISVLKIPMKGLLGGFHLELSDLVHATDVPGVQVADNDILFDTEKLLPPPHIRGKITSVEVSGPDLEVIYGGAKNDEAKLAQWHNFLKLTGGTLDFGKLTMRDVDLTMIDASDETWFDLDLANYQTQLVRGSTRMTPQAGLEIFMPSRDEKGPRPEDQTITMEWLKNRGRGLPAGVKVP